MQNRQGWLARLKPYAIALAGVIAATLVEAVIIDVFEQVPLFVYWPVVILIAWFGGLGPGLLAAALSIALANYFILPIRYTVSARAVDLALFLMFTAITVFMSWLRQREQHAQNLIRQRQLEMQITLASIGDGVIVTDAQGQVTFINPVAATLTGWSQADGIGRDIAEVFRIVNEETRQPASTPVMKAIEQGVIVGLANHTLLLSRAGEEWPISDSGAPIRGTGDEIIGAVLVFRDVSENRARERALEASEARYRHLVDNANDIIYTLDLEGRITSVNPAAEHITGYARSELLDMSLSDLVALDNMPHTQQMLERKLAGEEKTVYELEIITKTRQRRTLEISSQLTDGNGAPVGVEGVARDITVRKQAEQRSLTLHNLSAALTRAITLSEVVSVIIDQVLDALGAHHGAVALVSGDGQTLELLRLTNLSEEEFERYRSTPMNVSGPMTDAVRTGAPVWLETQSQYVERYPLYQEVVLNITKTQAAAALPLRIRTQIIGSVMFSFPEPRQLSAEEQDFLKTIADYCAQSIERAQLYEAEQQAREALQTRVRQQSIVAQIGQQALISHDLAGLMQTTVARVATTLAVDFAKILELREDQLLLKAGVGWREGLVGKATVSGGLQSQAGFTLSSSEPVIVEDLAAETRFSGPPLLHEHGITSGMSVIIQGYQKPYGEFGVHTREKRAFTQDDIYFLQSVANIIGAAIENARLAEQTKAAAALEERQRLARELHDSVTQSMFAATSRAELIPRLWERDPNTGMEHLQQVIMLNRGAMAEMRALLLELRPEAILNNALDTLYQQLVDAAPARAEIKAELIVEGEAQMLPPEVHLAFYRIVQESVNNILKHSQATTFQVTLVYTDNEVKVTVVDDGQGFDTHQIQAGLGIGSMQERAKTAGATLEIASKNGEGTTVLIRWASSSMQE